MEIKDNYAYLVLAVLFFFLFLSSELADFYGDVLITIIFGFTFILGFFLRNPIENILTQYFGRILMNPIPEHARLIQSRRNGTMKILMPNEKPLWVYKSDKVTNLSLGEKNVSFDSSDCRIITSDDKVINLDIDFETYVCQSKEAIINIATECDYFNNFDRKVSDLIGLAINVVGRSTHSNFLTDNNLRVKFFDTLRKALNSDSGQDGLLDYYGVRVSGINIGKIYPHY